MSDCGRYLIVTPQKGCQDNLVYISDLQKVDYKIDGKLDLIPIITKIEADYEVGILSSKFTCRKLMFYSFEYFCVVCSK